MCDFTIGEKLYTIGLNMQCKPVITTVVYMGPDKKTQDNISSPVRD